MAEKRKTEIIIGFEEHDKKSLKKAIPYMKEADVIFLERIPGEMHVLRGRGAIFERGVKKFKEQLKSSGEGMIKWDKLRLSLMGRLKKEGKKIDTWDVGRNYRHLPSEIGKLQRGGKLEEAARLEAQWYKNREEAGITRIIEKLPSMKGKKIFIQAGGMHTALYHILKKELEPRGVSVNAVYLTKGKYGPPRVSIKYAPYHELARMFRFDTKSAKDKKVINKLIEEQHEFEKEVGRTALKKYSEIRPKNKGDPFTIFGKAERRAIGEVLKRRTGYGLRKV
jgi:hypothetical protein